MSLPRRLLEAAWLSYRALFTWLNPWGYVSSRIVMPVMLTLLFGALGRFTGTGTSRPAIGGPLLAVALAGLYGMTLAVANERNFGTLEIRAATPESFLEGLVGKAIPHVLDGLLNGLLTMVVAAVVLGVHVPAAAVGPLVAAGLAVAFSSASLGVLAAAFSVRTRDTFTAPNVFELVLTLLGGVFIAPARLPLHLGAASAVLPLRHGVQAALAALAGHGMAWQSLATELAVGFGWGLAGYAFLRWMLFDARRRATLQVT